MNETNDDEIKNKGMQPQLLGLMSPDDMQLMLQELHVHQIELEKQTEELRSVQSEVEDLRNRSEEIIISQLNEISSYYDNAPIGLAVLNTDLCYLRVNRLLAEMNGIPVVDHIGKTIGELLPMFEKQAREVASTIITTGKPIEGVEFVGETAAKPGVQHIWREGWYPLKNNDGTVIGLTVIVQDITEFRRTAEALHESEKRYQEIFDSSFDALFIQDMLTNSIIDVNKTMMEMYGYASKEEVLKYTIEDLSAVEEGYNKEKIEQMNQNAIDLNTNSFEWYAKKKSGELFWVQVSLRSVNIGGKNRILASVRDISDRKRAQHQANERLKELQAFYNLAEISEKQGITLDEFYEDFINILPQSFQYTDIACVRITINDRKFCTKNFVETEWMLSAPFKVNGDVNGKIDVGYLKERPELDEGPFMNEERLLINAIAKRIGQIIGRKQTEDVLRFKNLVFDVSIVGNFIADLDGIITEVNDMLLRLWGYSNRSEVIGKPIDSFIANPTLKADIIKFLYTTGQWEGEIVAKRKDESTFIAYGLGTMVRDENNNIIGYQAALMDITERKQAEELLKNYNSELEQRVSERTAVAENRARKLHVLSRQLIRAEEKERKRIAYILHTEVQQVLIGARIALQTGMKEVTDISPLDSFKAADRMLEEALVETCELVHEIVPPVLREGGLREAIIWLSHQMRERHDFSVNVQGDDNYLRLDDEVSICAYQSVREMLLNICKHTNVRDAEVALNKVDDNWFNLIVQDKGVGISEIENLKTNEHSNGFGLFNIREQVEGLGGCMEIKSTVGEGTSISLFLPMKKIKKSKRKSTNNSCITKFYSD
ncbi:MAG: PAS domain S-box protein [bacterium]